VFNPRQTAVFSCSIRVWDLKQNQIQCWYSAAYLMKTHAGMHLCQQHLYTLTRAAVQGCPGPGSVAKIPHSHHHQWLYDLTTASWWFLVGTQDRFDFYGASNPQTRFGIAWQSRVDSNQNCWAHNSVWYTCRSLMTLIANTPPKPE
jgi:hypothetical protein